MENLLRNLAKNPAIRETVRSIPESAGIYTFFNDKTPIYVGKAINLKRRVGSYFDLHLDPKTARMVSEAKFISFIQVTSELEALLLEAKLIREYMPQYNIAAKDDKHPLYIIITEEIYPRVITARKSDVSNLRNKVVYGPFPSSASVRSVLRMLRRIFPYSDHKISKRGCIYSHIGLCNPCPSNIEQITDPELKVSERKRYLNNIRRVKAVLDGKISHVLANLQKEMLVFSQTLDFENARQVRDQIKKLEYITQPQIPTEYFMENPNLYEDLRRKELAEFKAILVKHKITVPNISRIECFDIAHLAGSSPTASMVTFIKAEPDKKFYRHFRIRQEKSNSDVDSLREVIKRRINHLADWGKPDVVIVDGGKPQAGVFIRELAPYGIPVVGLAKRFETLVIPNMQEGTIELKEYKLPRGNVLNLVQRLRDEAHRFARRYHHVLISKELTANENNH